MTDYGSAFTRPPAPPPLDLVQAFLNSVDLEEGADEFATVALLRAWVAERVPDAGTGFSEADRRQLIALREALRDLVEDGATDAAAGAAAAATLQEALDALPLTLRLAGDNGPELIARAAGIDAVLARTMAGVYRAMIEGSWVRLKICHNDVCRWAFYDASKNHSGVWCSMATCGSQAKARAYRRRARRKESATA